MVVESVRDWYTRSREHRSRDSTRFAVAKLCVSVFLQTRLSGAGDLVTINPSCTYRFIDNGLGPVRSQDQ